MNVSPPSRANRVGEADLPPLHAWVRRGGGEKEPGLPDHDDAERPGGDHSPILWLSADDEIHRFKLIDAHVELGGAPTCDAIVGHILVDQRHVRLTLGKEDVWLEVLGQRGIIVLGRKVFDTAVLPYRFWFEICRDVHAAVCPAGMERPYEL